MITTGISTVNTKKTRFIKWKYLKWTIKTQQQHQSYSDVLSDDFTSEFREVLKTLLNIYHGAHETS